MCVVCRKVCKKDLFVRIVKNKDGKLLIDYTKKADGRGAYICTSRECIQAAERKKALERSFKTKVEKSVYTELESIINTVDKLKNEVT